MAAEPKAVSLSMELGILGHAIDGARRLAETAMEQTERDAYRMQPVIASVLALVVARMRELDQVVRGELSAERLMAAHNTVDAKAGDVVTDILLTSRSPQHGRTGQRRS